MKLPRRQFLHLAAGVVALPSVSRIAQAQTYPSRPVRIIVGYAAGGAFDVTARVMGQWLSGRLAQPFIIENRTGAGGTHAVEAVAHAPADGEMLLLVGTPEAINATLYDNLNFSLLRDIAAVGGIIQEPSVMVVAPSFPAKTVPEFIAYAKANPGKVNMATAGVGGVPHAAGELFKMMAGVDLVPVHYRGGSPAVTDLLRGQVQVMFIAMSASIAYIRAGGLRPLAVTTATRVDVLPDIPTMGEFVPDYEVSGWQGIGAPKNTPVSIIEKLNTEINAGLSDPTMKARFAERGAKVLPGSPADFGKLIAEETAKWAKVIKFANIKPE
jgi:tripartite-type tricarboxylate transporter receptor subunit TctC